MLLKKDTAANIVVFMADETDNIVGKTGLSLTITASKDGAAFASISPTVTELTNGFYKLALTTAHTDTKGALEIYCTGTGAIPGIKSCQVVTDLPGDSVASIATAGADTLVDLIWDEVLTGATHNVASSAGRRLRQITSMSQVDSSVNDGSATTTTFITNLTSAVNDFYKDQLIVFTSGALTGQARPVLSYNGTTKAITVSEALTSAPADTVTFTLLSHHIHPVTQIAQGVWDALSTALTTSGSIGKRIVDYLTGDIFGRIGAPVGANISADIAAIPTNPMLATQISTIKKNTNLNNWTFKMVDTNGDPVTGLFPTCLRSIDGGALAAFANSATEISDGWYKINIAASDVNGDVIGVDISGTGAISIAFTIRTQP